MLDLIYSFIYQLNSVSPELATAASMFMFYVVNILAFLLGQPTFCSTPSVCL